MEFYGLTIHGDDLMIYGFTIGAYVLKQIDLNRIRKGKRPLFNFIDLIKINRK
jgi:hypothetical protein